MRSYEISFMKRKMSLDWCDTPLNSTSSLLLSRLCLTREYIFKTKQQKFHCVSFTIFYFCVFYFEYSRDLWRDLENDNGEEEHEEDEEKQRR